MVLMALTVHLVLLVHKDLLALQVNKDLLVPVLQSYSFRAVTHLVRLVEPSLLLLMARVLMHVMV